MHDRLFEQQDEWGSAGDAVPLFVEFAGELGLDGDAFAECLRSGKYEEAVLANFDEGAGIGVSGTPAFYVGTEFVDGAQPFEVFQQALEAQLAEAEAE
jgi:predicted DsbA family dithiol-disulfide isomerase